MERSISGLMGRRRLVCWAGAMLAWSAGCGVPAQVEDASAMAADGSVDAVVAQADNSAIVDLEPARDAAAPDAGDDGDLTLAAPDLREIVDGNTDLALPPDLTPLPDLTSPDLTVPDLTSPDLALPDLALPDLALPDLALPDLT